MKRQGAATFTEATVQEWETWLKRAFHALHPTRGDAMGEVVFDLYLSDNVGIRIRTTVPTEGSVVRKSGADVIILILYNFARNKPIIPKTMVLKAKRTQGWRDTVKDRIEQFMELYDEHEEEIEQGRFIDWSKKPTEAPAT